MDRIEFGFGPSKGIFCTTLYHSVFVIPQETFVPRNDKD
jgi:hypothetical protein